MEILAPILFILGIVVVILPGIKILDYRIDKKYEKRVQKLLKIKNDEVANKKEIHVPTGLFGLEDLFAPNEEFCPMCWTNNYFWVGGGSWSVDRCPNHRNSDEAVLWKNMSRGQKKVAAKKMDEMWMDKYFFNKKQRGLYE